MADRKISALAEQTSLEDTNEFVIADSGVTKRVTAATMLGLLPGRKIPGALSAGDQNTIQLDRSISPWAQGRNLLAIIDPFKAITEIREVKTATGSTVDLDRALSYAHDAGSSVFLTDTDEISTYWFGVACDDSTDDWAKLQRAQFEAVGLNLTVMGSTRKAHRFSKPLMLLARTKGIQLTASTSFPINEDFDWMCAVMSGERQSLVTGTAADDTFTGSAAHQLSVGEVVVFVAPTGETLPGNVSEGVPYFVKTAPTSTTFTVSATDGGATLDVSSDGTGWVVAIINQSQIQLRDCVIKGGSNPGIKVLGLATQQGFTCHDLQVYGGGGSADQGGRLLMVHGQIGNFYNTKLYPNGDGDTALTLWGLAQGHNFYGLNIADFGNGPHTGVDIDSTIQLPQYGSTGAISPSFFGLWTEACANYHVRVTDGSPLIQGWRASAASATAALQVDNSKTYKVDAMTVTGGNPTNIVVDSGRAYSLTHAGSETTYDIVQPTGAGDPTVTTR